MNSSVKNERLKGLYCRLTILVMFLFLLFKLLLKKLDIILASVYVFQQVFTIFTELVLIYC